MNKKIEIMRHNKSKYFNVWLNVKTCLQKRTRPYSIKAPYTKHMQVIIQVEIEVNDFEFGDFELTLMNRLIRHKNTTMSKAILPGIISWGIKKLI